MMRRRAPSAALLTAALALGACAGDRGPGDRAMGQDGIGLVQAPVTAPVCADGPTTFGIDVSKWQGAIDWGQVAGAGVKFAFIRVSHGLNYVDQYFETNWAGAKAHGILRGTYQYFAGDQDPIAQADLLIAKVNANGGTDLPPVLDVEETDGQSPAELSARIGQWLDHVEAALGMKPIIYTGSYFWEGNVASAAHADHPLWIAHWGVTCPKLPAPWGDWTFHQYSATGSVAGIAGDVDLDRFNGSLADLQALGGTSECLADPAYTACSGDAILSCQGASLVSTACGDGHTCSAAGGGPHCVATACAGAETGAACLDDTRLGACVQGAYSVLDCAADGGRCSDQGGVGHCVHFSCWTNLDGGEDGRFCVDQTRLATCASGAYSESDCAAQGARCSDLGGAGHCVDDRCAAGLPAGVETGTFCVGDATLATCTGGLYAARPCGAGGSCTVTAQGAICAGDQPPPEGDTWQGAEDTAVWPDGTLPWPDTGGPPMADGAGPLPDGGHPAATVGRVARDSGAAYTARRADGGCGAGGRQDAPWAGLVALGAWGVWTRRRRGAVGAPEAGR